MYLYEPILKKGLIDQINKVCNTSNESYPNVEKIANIHDGLEEYFNLASESASRGLLDDTRNSSIPVETQNLVSGTNAYKISSFTNDVLKILRVAILDSSGIEHDLAYEPFDSIIDFSQTYSSSITGLPAFWTRIGDYIYLNATPNYSYTAGLRCYVDRALTKFTEATVTITEANPGVATSTAHGLVDGDAILLFTDGALPTNLTADTTIYYVDQQTADTFKICTTPSAVGSTYVNTTGSVQSGTHKFIKVNVQPGIPSLHHKYLVFYAADRFMDTAHPKFQKNRADLTQMERKIQDYWEAVIPIAKTVIEPNQRAYK